MKYTVNGGVFVQEKPRVWAAKVGGTAQALSVDGSRLVVLAQAETTGTPKAQHDVVFLQNFFDELRRRVPAQ